MISLFRANDRINLYPAAPIRLATMLNAWTITKYISELEFSCPSPDSPINTAIHGVNVVFSPLQYALKADIRSKYSNGNLLTEAPDNFSRY